MSDTIKKSLWAAVDEHCAKGCKTLAALQKADAVTVITRWRGLS